MRTAIVSALALMTLLGTVADAQAQRCRCGRAVEHRVYYRAVPADFYRGPASDYQAYSYKSRGGIGPPGWPQQYVSYDPEHPGRCGPDRRWQDGRCVSAR